MENADAKQFTQNISSVFNILDSKGLTAKEFEIEFSIGSTGDLSQALQKYLNSKFYKSTMVQLERNRGRHRKR